MSAGTGSASTAGDYKHHKGLLHPAVQRCTSDYKEWRKRINIYVMKMRVAKREPEGFEYDRTVQLPNDFDRYFSQLQRRPGQTLLEYTTEHDHLYSKLADHDVTLPSKVQGWHLLRRAGLSKEQKQLVTTQAPNMERNKVQEALFLILGQDHKTVAGGGTSPCPAPWFSR